MEEENENIVDGLETGKNICRIGALMVAKSQWSAIGTTWRNAPVRAYL